MLYIYIYIFVSQSVFNTNRICVKEA